MAEDRLVIVTRGSLLARTQTEWVAAQLRERHPGLEVELSIVTTTGDRRTEPLPAIGGKGLFTHELEQALLSGNADLAVHSLKDLPTDLPGGLGLGAVPAREEARDAIVLPQDAAPADSDDPLALLLPGMKVGTSSLRRTAFLRHRRPDLVFESVRGNLDTRLRKLDEGRYDALVLAAAGLRRLGWPERISALLPVEVCTPSAGQGALGIETRADDERVAELLAVLDDAATRAAVAAERAFLNALGGGCQVPCGAHARPEGDGLLLTGAVADAHGLELMARTAVAPQAQAESVGAGLAKSMWADGAQRLLTEG